MILTKDTVQSILDNNRMLEERAKLLAIEYCKKQDISYDSISIRGVSSKEIVFDIATYGLDRIHTQILGIPTEQLYR